MTDPDRTTARGRRYSRRDLLRTAAAGSAGLVLSGLTGGSTHAWGLRGPSGTALAAPAGDTLVHARSIDLISLDPHRGNLAAHRVLALVYDALVSFDDQANIVPSLAQEWDIDYNKYTFRLRRGVQWHNGREFTAEDVKFSFEHLLNPANGASRRGDISIINAIDVLDRYTVRFTLQYPAGGFLGAVADQFLAVVPREVLTRDPRAVAIGTGPYTIREWVRDNRTVLAKNPNYYLRGRPYIDTIVVQTVPEETSVINGLRSGAVHWTRLQDNRNFSLVQSDRRLVSQRGPGIGMEFVVINCSVAPFTDVRVRQALSWAIDRQEILQGAIGGHGVLTGPLPAALKGWALPVDDLPSFKPNLDRARQLLTAAGFPRGFRTEMTVIPTFPSFVAAAQIIADQLRRVGIEVTITPVELGVWLNRLNVSRDMPLTINATQGSADPDFYLYGRFHTRGFNQPNWREPEVERLLDRGKVISDPARRKPIYDELQRMLVEKVPYLWLYTPAMIDIMQPFVEGMKQHPTSFYYGLRDTKLNR